MKKMAAVIRLGLVLGLLPAVAGAAARPDRLLVPGRPVDRTIAFEFAGAGNLKGPNAGHMHDATFRLIDAGRFASRWTFYENDKPKFTEDNEYTRIQ